MAEIKASVAAQAGNATTAFGTCGVQVLDPTEVFEEQRRNKTRTSPRTSQMNEQEEALDEVALASEADDADVAVRGFFQGKGINAGRVLVEYRCNRVRPDGKYQEFRIQIFDFGTENPHIRYRCDVSARLSDGKLWILDTHHSESVHGALHRVHWRNLDAGELGLA